MDTLTCRYGRSRFAPAAFVCPFAAVFALLLPLALAAQQPSPDSLPHDSSVIAVGEIVVRVTRPVATTGGASAYIADLDSLRAVEPVPTMDQVLREMPLVQVRANSRGESQLSLRGAGERQVAVLVDGVPLTLGWDHRTDLSVLPMTAARSITLVRGLSSVLHGPNVLGGVVEVGVARSPDPIEAPEPTRFMGSVDQLGGHTLGAVTAAVTSAGSGSLKLRAGAGYRSRPGFARSHGLPDPFAAGDTRINSDLRHVDGFLAARYAGGAGQWASFSASGFDAERGVPPELHTDKPRFWRYPDARRMVAALSAGTGDRATGLGVGDLEMSVGLDLGHTHVDDYTSTAYDQIQQTELDDDRTVTLRVLAEHTLGGSAQLRAAATFADVRHDESIRDLTTGERFPGLYAQRLWSVGSELAWHLEPTAGAGGRAGFLNGGRLSAGVVLDGSDTPETGGAPSAGSIREWGGRLGATLVAHGDDMLLHAAVSRRGRFPALRELYSSALGKFEPNPDLVPEILTAAEVGITTRVAGLELQAVGFHHRMTNAIVRTSAPDGSAAKYMRINRDEIRSTGVELLTGWRWTRLTVEGDLTIQHVEAIEPGAAVQAPHVEYQPNVSGNLDLTASLAARLRATAGVEYVGRQYCVDSAQPDGYAVIAPAAALDLGIGRDWRLRQAGAFRTVNTTFVVDNVTDTNRYDQCGLPQAGRTFRVQFVVR